MAHGAERLTEDADCVVDRERVNLDRLAEAVRQLLVRLRVAGVTDEEAELLPVQLDGASLAHLSIATRTTDAGRIDVLAGLEAADAPSRPREELLQRATGLHGQGLAVHAAGLEDIIRAIERADRPKDREALRELRASRDFQSTRELPGRGLPNSREIVADEGVEIRGNVAGSHQSRRSSSVASAADPAARPGTV